MPIVYHLMPRDMVGDTLYPLNQLRQFQPEIYAKHARKYEGRQQVTERRIPILNCLWNDVLFFSPVHPAAIKNAFMSIGKTWKPQNWFAVDTVALDFNPGNAVIYYPDMQREKGDFTAHPERFIPFIIMTPRKAANPFLSGADYRVCFIKDQLR